MTDDSNRQSDWQTRDQVAGAVFLIGVITGLLLFTLVLDDRITSSWGDWLGQGSAMILGVVVAGMVLHLIMSRNGQSLTVSPHHIKGSVNGILLIASVWGAAAAAAYWGSQRLSSAVWLMSLGTFCLLLHKFCAPDRNLGCWVGLYVALFVLGTLAAAAEIMHWD